MMHVLKLLITLQLLDLMSTGVGALHCWNCTTTDASSDCGTGAAPTLLEKVGDILGYTDETSHTYRRMTCNESIGTVVCSKTMTQTVDGVTYVSRGCNYGYKTGCKINELLGRVATLCFCDKDFCNSASNQLPAVTLTGAMIVFIALVLH